MAKKKVIKRKWKLYSISIFLLVLISSCFVMYLLFKEPIKNIYIKGNTILKDDEIISIAGLTKYPSFLTTWSNEIKIKLVKNSYIKDVKVIKKFFNTIEIEITENKPLFIKELDKKLVFENKKEIENYKANLVVPTLINSIDKKYYEKFIEEMSKVHPEILNKISEIEYKPTEYDQGRFLLYMNDGNYVYLTLTKFNKINYYNKTYKELNGKKGILHFDSGDHFEIKE